VNSTSVYNSLHGKVKITLISFDFILSQLVMFVSVQKLMYVQTDNRHVLFIFYSCIGTYSTDLTNMRGGFHM
jgi:hypothetical protein